MEIEDVKKASDLSSEIDRLNHTLTILKESEPYKIQLRFHKGRDSHIADRSIAPMGREFAKYLQAQYIAAINQQLHIAKCKLANIH